MTVLAEMTKQEVSAIGGILIAVFTVMLIATISNMFEDHVIAGFITLAIAVACMLGVIRTLEPHRKIKVILSDDYSAVELYEKYNVIEREGDIWTLEEKEADGEE